MSVWVSCKLSLLNAGGLQVTLLQCDKNKAWILQVTFSFGVFPKPEWCSDIRPCGLQSMLMWLLLYWQLPIERRKLQIMQGRLCALRVLMHGCINTVLICSYLLLHVGVTGLLEAGNSGIFTIWKSRACWGLSRREAELPLEAGLMEALASAVGCSPCPWVVQGSLGEDAQDGAWLRRLRDLRLLLAGCRCCAPALRSCTMAALPPRVCMPSLQCGVCQCTPTAWGLEFWHWGCH